MFEGQPDFQIGLGERQRVALMYARGGSFAKGDLVMLDLAQSDGATRTVGFNDPESVWSNVVTPTAASRNGGAILGICLADISDDATGFVCFSGVIEHAMVWESGAGWSASIGDKLVAEDAATVGAGVGGSLFSGTASANRRYIGVLQEAVSSQTGRVLRRIWFNGIYGFGTAA